MIDNRTDDASLYRTAVHEEKLSRPATIAQT
jgi:hypothetical protein